MLPRRVPDRWLAPLVVAGVFTVASVVPTPSGDSARVFLLGVGVDKWLHAVGSAGLVIVLARALRRGGNAVTRTVVLVVAGGLAYGAGIELLQIAVPARNADHLDFAADAAGVFAGTLTWWAVDRWTR